MSFTNSVTIGPGFFSKAFNDYSNKYWAFAREILQNSIDCGSTTIDIHVHDGLLSGSTVVTVENDGEPMSKDVLVDKLLSLGESGKDFRGSVGGFGKAKEILYFAHRDYTIVTGGLQVEGSGAGYNLTEAAVPRDGTMSTVTWEGNHAEELKGQFLRFIELCGTGSKVHFTLNRVPVLPEHAPGVLNRTLDRDETPWAEVRLSEVESNVLVVRIGGIPMFHSRCDFKGTVTLELLGTSGQRLMANRDGLLWAYSDQLRDFITSIAVDRQTVFKLEKAVYRRHRGPKLRRQAPGEEAGIVAVAARAEAPEPMGGGGILVDVLARDESPNPLGHEFIVKNCVRKDVPDEYAPATFGAHATWLAKAWAGCLLELYDLYRVDHGFSVGFIFSEDVEAEYEKTVDYGRVYYLNPCQVSAKSHKRRYTKADRSRILAAAAHEFVHGGLGESYHGEDYANKLTEVMATVMKHARRFSKHLN